MNAAPDASRAPPAAPAAARPHETVPPTPDKRTADAFATSWNGQHASSVYTKAQFEEWFRPTASISRATIEGWLRHPDVYILQRNGNSWKFGGRRREAA